MIIVKAYDHPACFDRYTVIYIDPQDRNGTHECLGMSHKPGPFHPQGFCQHSTANDGPHLGNRIKIANLPKDCQEAVIQDLNGIAWKEAES